MFEPDNIEDLYRKAVEGLNEDPGPEAWERIADDLDVRDVWTRLESSLDKRDRKIIFFRRVQVGVAAALIPLFLTFIGFQIFKTDPAGNKAGGNYLTSLDLNLRNDLARLDRTNVQNEDAEQAPGQAEDKLFANAGNQNASGNSQQTKVAPDKKLSTPLNKTDRNERFALVKKEQLQGKFEVSREWIEAGRLNEIESYAIAFELAEGQRRGASDMYQGFEASAQIGELDPGDEEKTEKVFALGAISGVKNQWMLSPNTMSSFKKEADNYNELTFSGSAGLSAAMVLSNKFDLQTDLMLLSRNGQKQVEYQKGRAVDSEVGLGYSKLLVMTKWKNARIKLFDKPLTGALVGGMYGAYLVSQEQTLGVGDNVYKTSPQNYRDTDFGLVGGYELNYLLSDHFELAPGIRYQQGLMNIFRGNEATPSQLNNTLNTSFEVNVGFRYRFGGSKSQWK